MDETAWRVKFPAIDERGEFAVIVIVGEDHIVKAAIKPHNGIDAWSDLCDPSYWTEEFRAAVEGGLRLEGYLNGRDPMPAASEIRAVPRADIVFT